MSTRTPNRNPLPTIVDDDSFTDATAIPKFVDSAFLELGTPDRSTVGNDDGTAPVSPRGAYMSMESNLQNALHAIGVTWASEPTIIQVMAIYGVLTIDDMLVVDDDTLWDAYEEFCGKMKVNMSITLKVKLKLLRKYYEAAVKASLKVNWATVTMADLRNVDKPTASGIETTDSEVKWDVSKWNQWNGDPKSWSKACHQWLARASAEGITIAVETYW